MPAARAARVKKLFMVASEYLGELGERMNRSEKTFKSDIINRELALKDEVTKFSRIWGTRIYLYQAVD